MLTVIGIRRVEYTSRKTGRDVRGTELHCTEERNDVIGQAVEKVFVSERVDVGHVSVNDRINVYYNRFGQVDFIEVK